MLRVFRIGVYGAAIRRPAGRFARAMPVRWLMVDTRVAQWQGEGTESGAAPAGALRTLVAAAPPVDTALLGSETGTALTYAQVLASMDGTGRVLRHAGIRRNDRVAVVLPNGTAMALAFLGVAAYATCAPLNPAYTEAEFAFYLDDLQARAVIVSAGDDTIVRRVAAARSIQVLEATPAGADGALFAGDTVGEGGVPDAAHPGDVALVLHTSGTTSRPKIVPLTHANICASADHIRASLALTSADRCLNVMPLFHIHGLVGVLLSSLAAGASVVCTPGFLAPSFLTWLAEFRPTWYSAVPTMHQSVLARGEANPAAVAGHALRFVRSCSSALPPQVMADLERLLGVPVVEAYGMTEASHQMTSNPLPPAARKPGSVGLPTGTAVAIMAEDGALLSAGMSGEIVVRGPNVTAGYESNPQANERAFTDGWFRTGDQGYLDADGYLFITGRLKEIINRGGEKISPREIDEALLAHPAVAQAVAFAVPHPRLGEDVAAAVVLRPDAAATEAELRRFAAGRLADFKVPSAILVLQEIPKGPTGKVQRIGLAERLGLTGEPAATQDERQAAEHVAPRTPLESQLAAIWAQVLGVSDIGVQDDFLQIGGDSVLAALIISRIREAMQVELTPFDFFAAPTVEGVALCVVQRQAATGEQGELTGLLAELETLSDEEVERLLGEQA